MTTTTTATKSTATTTDTAPPITAPAPAAQGGAGFDLDGLLADGTHYVVQNGESLKSIAAKLGVTIEALKAANVSLLKTWQTDRGPVQGFEAGATITVPIAQAPAPAPELGESEQEPATPEAPSLGDQIFGLVDRVTSAVRSLFGSITTPDGKEVAPDGVALDECPADPAAPPDPAVVPPEMKQFTQTLFYDGSGNEIKDSQWIKDILVKHGIWGDYDTRGEAYNAYLQTPVDARGDKVGAETVPQDVKKIPQLAYIPGEASCLRTAKAMAAQRGVTIEGGSGVQTSHIQVILASDQELTLDENGNPINVFKTNKNIKHVHAKDPSEIEAEHLAVIQANVALARQYMDEQLAAGKCVVIGVSYSTRNGNKDQTTDHWMCVHAKQGDTYLYFDPGKAGTDGCGVLSVNTAKGGILEGKNADRTYELAQVQLNVAKGGPTDEAVAKGWKAKAGEANAELAKGTEEEAKLKWK